MDMHAKRLQNQERITKSIADDLEEQLGPLGSAVLRSSMVVNAGRQSKIS